MRWVIGIDEAGRGPLAGPIAVGAVAIPVQKNEWKFWEGLKDSKRLNEKQREYWFEKLWTSDVHSSVSLVGAAVIDRVGITRAAQTATMRSIMRLALTPEQATVQLDRGLSVPSIWQQEQLVKGDERIPVIALASIVAKVTRDRHMIRLAKQFPAYGFERHKGYGTHAHYLALDRHGPCTLHRQTFL